jgi:hypothetical protein
MIIVAYRWLALWSGLPGARNHCKRLFEYIFGQPSAALLL